MLILITGCIMAGKSTRLKRYIEECDDKYLLFTHKIDVRENRSLNEAIRIGSIREIRPLIYNHRYIFIDEIQFFDVSDIEELLYLSSKYDVVVAGLDKDYLNKEFEMTREIKKIANKIETLFAWCDICGKDAELSYKINGGDERINVSAKYIPLCKDCYNKVGGLK